MDATRATYLFHLDIVAQMKRPELLDMFHAKTTSSISRNKFENRKYLHFNYYNAETHREEMKRFGLTSITAAGHRRETRLEALKALGIF